MIWAGGRLCILLCLLGQVLTIDSDTRSPQFRPGGAGEGWGRRLLQTVPSRPQNPKPPLPYSSINVTFSSFVGPKVTLAGTLTLPNTPPPHPAVLLVSGAGPTDRDQTIFGHKHFLVLSDHLTRNGIAVLRYDDRGVGESTGDHFSATAFGLADDAIGGLRYLKTRGDIDPGSVGLLGTSEGGIIAPIAVSKLKDTGKTQWMPSFLVLAAPPATRGNETNALMMEQVSEAAGLTPEEVEAVLEATKKVNELVRDAENVTSVEEEVRDILDEVAEPYAKALATGFNVTVEGNLVFILTPWYKATLAVDPVTFFRRVDLPVLVLMGSNDAQVPLEHNEDKIRDAFANNPNANITVVDGANHAFQFAERDVVTKMVDISETIAPPVLDIISKWILERSGKSD